MLGPMCARQDVALATLEMQAGDSPCGALISADGRRRPFSGWADFAVVIGDWLDAIAEEATEHNTG